jgi:hypothetical protein
MDHERAHYRLPEQSDSDVLLYRKGSYRARLHCHFRKTATGYDRKPGIKWLSCTVKWWSGATLGSYLLASARRNSTRQADGRGATDRGFRGRT